MAETAPFHGVTTPLVTPFNADLSVDPARFVALARRLLEQGCVGLAPFGTTGEALSLGIDERRMLLEALVDGGVGPARLMPGVGLCAIPDTVALTRHAVDLGCGGVMMLPPFFYKGVSDDGIFAHVAEVVDRVERDALRIYLYHIPPQAVIGYSRDLVARLIDAFPNIVVGLKDSSGDWENTSALISAHPGFTVLSGNEFALLANLRAGGGGCITATANVNAEKIAALCVAWRADPDDPSLDGRQAEITAIRERVQATPMIPTLKGLIAAARATPDWSVTRPPLPRVAPETIAQTATALETDFGLRV